ncbi:hypothetical protein BDV28DRAFT_12257 [Aspergillus coremiiformis]|uniref:Uncharacterized protein n=1 Tax=Aspergillus coremiiformis TaxID=138285 RepID=A0A5N6Z420_9EURO|nr:hypothetical protein BDV28DRAFT_12257 [Aspergillus coremiiformis]
MVGEDVGTVRKSSLKSNISIPRWATCNWQPRMVKEYRDVRAPFKSFPCMQVVQDQNEKSMEHATIAERYHEQTSAEEQIPIEPEREIL